MHVSDSEILFIDWTDQAHLNYYSLDKNKNFRITDRDYFLNKIVGTNYKKIEHQLPASIEHYSSTIAKNGDIYFCTYREDNIYRFDKNGLKTLEWQIEFGIGHPIYDIKYEPPDYIWLAFPTGQTVSQVSISKQKEIFRIGEYTYEDDSKLLCYPESLFITETHLYIPNMGNKRLYKMDLNTKEMDLIYTFEEKLWQYVETEFGTFILSDSGIYEIQHW